MFLQTYFSFLLTQSNGFGYKRMYLWLFLCIYLFVYLCIYL